MLRDPFYSNLHVIAGRLGLTFALFSFIGCSLDNPNEGMFLDMGIAEGSPIECTNEVLNEVSEACDGYDNDCDGQVDEGFVSCDVERQNLAFRFCSNPCCVSDQACDGDNVCHPLGQLGRCDLPCNDGDLRLCSYGCAPVFQTCVGRVWAICEATRPQVEQCNGADDDCDGEIDEGLACGGLDASIPFDLSVEDRRDGGLEIDATTVDADIVDAVVDMAIVDSAVPPPECNRHADCPRFELCFRNDCEPGLPGTFNITIYSARIGDLPGDEPDMFGELKVGMNLLGTTDIVDNDDTPTWNHRIRVGLDSQQILELCIWDHDGFLNGNDLAGCSQFSTESVVEAIRSFRGTRMSPNWATFSPSITSGQSLDSVFLHVDRL